jgi:flagellar hook-basal body complex protein FliE
MSGVGPIGSLPLFAPHLLETGSIHMPTGAAGATGAIGSTGGTSDLTSPVPFADVLAGAIASANDKQVVASHAAQAFAAGARDDIHGTMIAVKEADIELKLVANVRNKLLDAFQDLWRLNV